MSSEKRRLLRISASRVPQSTAWLIQWPLVLAIIEGKEGQRGWFFI